MVKEKVAESKKQSVNKASISYGVGRRKKAIARVWLKRGGGKITVNGLTVESYFDTDVERSIAATPFTVTPFGSNYDVVVNVHGGGKSGQADAVKLGIARAFVRQDETLRAAFKKYKLLTVDSRVKERKKYGQKAARAKFQFVKR